MLEELLGATVDLIEELLETVVWLLLGLLGDTVERVLDETVVWMLLELLDGEEEWLLEVSTDLLLLELLVTALE